MRPTELNGKICMLIGMVSAKTSCTDLYRLYREGDTILHSPVMDISGS